jgi:hypothetical protein
VENLEILIRHTRWGGPVKKIIPLYIPFTGRKICTVDEENMAKRKREIVGKGRDKWGYGGGD